MVTNYYFDGWYDSTGNKVTESTIVTVTAPQTLTARYKSTATLVDNVVNTLDLNANDYTIESLKALDAAYKAVMNADVVTEQLAQALDAAYKGLQTLPNDGTGAKIEVYENSAVVGTELTSFDAQSRAAIEAQREGKGEISYVYPGKAFYTYYCYTNSTNPFILINTADIVNSTTGRVSYPTKVAASATDPSTVGTIATKTGIVKSGWMNYAYDTNDSVRQAGYTIGNASVANPYTGAQKLDFAGSKHGEGTDYSYYMQANYVTLTPVFVQNNGVKQFARYEFTVYDDSYEPRTADTATLAGAADFGTYATEGKSLETGTSQTPVHTVTIFVEYMNSMKVEDGETVTDAGGQNVKDSKYLYVWNNEACDGSTKWVYSDYLYRNAASAATTDFIMPLQADESGKYAEYLGSDPQLGNQNDVGSFYYLMAKTDAATETFWSTYDEAIKTMDVAAARRAAAKAALPLMKTKVLNDMKGGKLRSEMLNMQTQAVRLTNAPTEGAYVAWPYDTTKTVWSTQFYAPAATREETLVYVHVYDRYGNEYTNILVRDYQDLEKPTGAMTSVGNVEIHETGGSGIKQIKITEYTLGGSGQMVESLGGMTSETTWDTATNSFTVTNLGKGSHYNYVFSLYFEDNAGHNDTIDFRATPDRGGSVTIKVSDSANMAGAYGQEATEPLAGQSIDPTDVGAAAPMIGTDPLTTVTVDEVTAEEIKENTLVGAAAEPEQNEETVNEIYSFMLNEVYTVNLFALAGKDYNVILESNKGGVVKAYVDGQFTPAQNGSVTIPGGSEVQIRVACRAGYELESLQMIYSNGTAANLLGAYTAEITEDVTIRAMFAKTDEMLRLTVENGTVNGRAGALVSPYSQVTVVADAAPEGKQFAYWALGGADGTPVSYDDVYTFLVTGNTALTAVYSDTAVTRTASIAMDEASASHITTVNGRYSLSYSGKITLPEGAKIEEFGLVLTNQAAGDCTAENLVIGGAVNGVNNAKLTGTSLTEQGQCKLNVNNVASGQTRTGRLYLVVTLADGTTETLYSTTWSELITPAE